MTRIVKPRTARARDPYGVGPLGSLVAPIASVVGLLIIAIVTINLFNYELPFTGLTGGRSDNGNAGNPGPGATPAPSGVVVVPEQATFLGSIVYAKGGNIWIQTDEGARQLTTTGGASMPSFSADGKWVTYVQSKDTYGRWLVRGRASNYDLQMQDLMRISASGQGRPQRFLSGRVQRGSLLWSAWIRQPVLSPDGRTVALVTDAPNPDDSNVVLQFYDMQRKRLTRAGVPEVGVLGHQDPEWRPDGRVLLYTRNSRDGSRGAPVITRLDMKTKRTRIMTGPGYMQGSYSPDGRYIAATRTTPRGTDVVILNGSTGNELMRVTDDGASWAPMWSPSGDAIGFLHIEGQTVDLRLAKLDGRAPSWTVAETIDLTQVSGLDAASRPDWHIPPALLPAADPATAAPSAASPAP
jgi:dipeptidyl aminopeptidase/acylaminoacyl peptidase